MYKKSCVAVDTAKSPNFIESGFNKPPVSIPPLGIPSLSNNLYPAVDMLLIVTKLKEEPGVLFVKLFQ